MSDEPLGERTRGQFFCILATIYLAPHVRWPYAGVAIVVCLVFAVLAWLQRPAAR